MFELKYITPSAIPRALAKAERYRLLNEPEEAESICEDVLRIDPDNQEALVMLLLAITDNFAHGGRIDRARELLPRLRDSYQQAYYGGIICERWAKTQFDPNRSSPFVDNPIREAMRLYEKAVLLSPPGNDDAVLRWNACVRFIQNSRQLGAGVDDFGSDASFRDDV